MRSQNPAYKPDNEKERKRFALPFLFALPSPSATATTAFAAVRENHELIVINLDDRAV